MQKLERVNQKNKQERLRALEDIFADPKEREGIRPTDEVNNHVHTVYSFSPYFPTAAVYMAWKAGLKAVGCMDHDSVAGCGELMEACKIVGLGSTVGFELRVNFSGSKIEGYKINSPDSFNIGYIAVHGIPAGKLDEASEFLKPVNRERNRRNRKQVEKLNGEIVPLGLQALNFDKDVCPLSMIREGGSVTERHILYALVKQIVHLKGKGEQLVSFLQETLHVSVPDALRGFLEDRDNPHYEYDLLGVLKSTFMEKFFIQPAERECLSVFDVVDFANTIGAIPAYAYLGDVTESPTGDKKAEKFEDDYLDVLMPELKRIGFKAVTYMPPRNTLDQLKRIQRMCSTFGLMEISGVDINSSRQEFNCPIILNEEFRHLTYATWALIAHEKMSSRDFKMGLFHPENPYASLKLEEKIRKYSQIGISMDNHHPEAVMENLTSKGVEK